MNNFVTQYEAVIWVTLAYILLYYVFMVHGLVVRTRVALQCKKDGEPFLRYTKSYPEILATDRIQLNTLEHMPPFLVLMWLQALVVSASSATTLGAIYVIIRATYPFFMGSKIHKSFPKRVFINTFSGYAILTIFVIWQIKVLLT
jgi:hypothetical protein